MLKKYVSAEPDFVTKKISTDDTYMVIASDGLWVSCGCRLLVVVGCCSVGWMLCVCVCVCVSVCVCVICMMTPYRD